MGWFLLIPLIWVLGVVPAAILVVKACRVPRWTRTRGACGKCGYQVGLSTTCPECGSDVLTVGLASVRLAVRLGASLPVAILAWLWITANVVLVIGGYAMSWLVMSTMAAKSTDFTTRGLWSSAETLSADASIYRLHSLRTVDYSSAGEKAAEVMLVVDPMSAYDPDSNVMAFDSFAHVLIDGATHGYRIVDRQGQTIDQGPEFDVQASRRLHAAAGLDPEAEGIRTAVLRAPALAKQELALPAGAEAAEEPEGSRVLTVMGSGSGLMPARTSGWRRWGPEQWMAVLVVVALVVGALGSLGIWARRRRILRRAETPPAVRPGTVAVTSM